MRTLLYIFIFTVFTTFSTSCSKDSLTEDQTSMVIVATEGDDEKDKNEPGLD